MKLCLYVSQAALLLRVATATSTGFLNTSTSATTFCSSCLSPPVATVTFTPSAVQTVPSFDSTATRIVTSTVTSTAYSTAIATATSSIFSTSSNVVISTITSTFFSIGVSTTILTTFTTTITTAPQPGLLVKRAAPSQLKYITNNVGPVLDRAPTKTVTATTATLTNTSYSRETLSTATTTTLQKPTTSTTSTTQTVTQTVVVTSYITSIAQVSTTVFTSTTQTDTETDVITSVTTSAASVPVCAAPLNIQSIYGENGRRFFAGTGVSENAENPSNGGTPVTVNFAGSLQCADAINQCWNLATFAGNLGFDLHYLIPNAVWVCVSYSGYASSPSDFNVYDSKIGPALGYQFIK